MQFDISGHIIRIEQSEKTYCKCVIKDNFSSVIVLIPSSLLKHVNIDDEVEIWGQLKGYEFNGKIYNNLFAKGLIITAKKFVLVKIEEIGGENPHLKILQYSPLPFDTEKINKIILDIKDQTGATLPAEVSPVEAMLFKKLELAPYHNMYASHLEKAIQKEHVLREIDKIIFNGRSSLFFKEKFNSQFAFVFTPEVDELVEIPNSV